ncbi:titin isoform X2 [Chrysoperla carnea]|uniref:titin isoform X2 n=1 Tax=Chrysoperla carnea TaxID=189513 RepID=UPI001D0966AA|nr:titin isoform X2 [Chrysoperla carnea]XP_044731809.1 titin isoform X2 [Chrysoperla carnea]
MSTNKPRTYSKRSRRTRSRSEDSESSTTSRDVRCACQFFQSEELLPETRKNLVGTPPVVRYSSMIGDRMSPVMFNTQKFYSGDHEYEIINAPAEESRANEVLKTGPPLAREVEMEDIDDASSISSAERRFLRVPLDTEIIVPEDGQSEDAAMSDEGIGDDRCVSATPTTNDSRTDCELNTSQVDSSALEVLPLQRESRKQATLATEEVVNHPNIGQRMKSSASRIKTKLQNIRKTREATTDRPLKKTKIVKVKVERPKSERPSLLDRARKIERPKFSMPKMPDRPKFNMPKMPDMPKMPERPKINMPKMPDRPKMKMPDISMPKMPDISMPKMPDISMPKMPDFSSLGRKPKETTAAPVITSTITTTSESKKTTSTSDSPDDDAPKKKRFDFEFRHPKKTTSTSDSADDDAPKKKRFDFDFRTYPKILNRTKKQKTVVMAPLSTSTDQSVQSDDKPKSTFFTEYIPDWVTMPRKARKKVPVGQRWANKFSDIKFADDESLRSGKSKENVYVQEYPPPTPAPVIFNSNDPLVQYIPLKDPNKTLSDEEEEYEEDLGQENINTTNILYTTEEDIQPQIQEISPEKQEISPENLIKPPIVEEEIISEPELSPSPEVPEPKNTFAIIGTTNSGESLQPDSHREDRSYASSERGGVIEEINSDEFFVREKGLSQDNIDVSLYLSSEIREAFQNPINALSQMIENGVHSEDFVEYDRRLQEDYIKMRDQSPIFEPAQTPPTKTLRKKKKQSICSQDVSTISTDNIPERKIDQSDDNFKTYPPSRPSRSRKGSVASKKHDSQGISQNDLDLENNVIPQIPFRRKRSLRSAKSLNISEHFNDSLLRSDQNVSLQEIRSNNYAIEESPPVPKRRARSSHSRSTIHTINDDDRTSRGADSLISEDRNDTQNSISAPIRNYTPPGYAKVEKIKDNSNVPPAQPPPRTKRKKQIKETQFFTVPRRLKDEDTPQRPLRNYSTLRSSRKNSSSRQSTPAHDKENQIQDDEYIEIDDEEASHKKLQSGEVIQKMKSRPLPAPPRPPRKTTRHPNDGILKEIHIDNIEDANLLTSEDKTHSAKISNESIIKGTLLLDGNQINIDVHPISLEVEAENLANRLKDLQTEIIPNNERHITPEITIVDNDGKVDIPEKLDEGTEKQDISEKRLSNLSDRTTTPLVLGQFSIEEVEISTQTDPLPEDFVCEEVVAEPTDIIIIPTNRKNISEEITFVPVQEVPSTQRRTLLEQISFDPSEDGFTGSEMSPSIDMSDNPLDRHLDEIKVPKRGILEQQSHERLSESPVEPCDETYLKESLVRLARSEQSSLISRPVGDHEITQKVEYHPPRESAPPSTNIALPETLRVQRLQVSDLDVDRLTVSELMAQKLLVSEIDGMSLKLNDITSQSGTISTDEIKLPPHLIEEILSRLQSSIQMSQPPPVPAPTVTPPEVVEKRITYYKEESTNTDDSLPPPSEDTKSMQSSISIETVTESTATPKAPSTVNEIVSQAVPYPHIYVLPPSFYQHMTQPSTSTTAPPPTNVPPAPAPDPEIETIPDPSIPNLSAQLLRACHSSASNSIRQVIIQITSYLNSGDEKQDARTAIIVLIVLLAALILLGFSSRTEPVHHHHWEYFNPPTGDRPI